MTIESLLSRVKGVKKTSATTWMCKCPSHNDRLPSLSVRLAEDGLVLINCFGGCSPSDILAAVGLEMTDLWEVPLSHTSKPLKGPKVFARDVLKLMRTELMLFVMASFTLKKGKALEQVDQERLMVSYDRLMHALELAEIE